MAKSTGTYILVAMLIIPAVTMGVLLAIAQHIVNWWELILPVFVVYLASFTASIITRKACGKASGNWRKATAFLFIKTILFTFGIVATICYVVAGGNALFTVALPDVRINVVYLVTLVIAWGIMAGINEYMVK